MTFITDLTFTTPELWALDSWIINEELTTSMDHVLIVLDMANLDETVDSMRTSQEITEWMIKAISEDELEQIQAA